MRDDFAALILTHGRPERVYTIKSLLRSGYTGRWYMVVDDSDKTIDRYREMYGDEHVIVFSKDEIAKRIDEGNNTGDRRAIVYARNACWDIARAIGVRYFMQLDDDYTSFFYRYDSMLRYGSFRVRSTMDDMLSAMIDFFESIPASAIAMAQGGDYIGGDQGGLTFRRKCMNSWLCSVDRPFRFFGTTNEDVSAYVVHGRRGRLFGTILSPHLVQVQTQAAAGGMSDLYAKFGTYVKSMTTVLCAPSCVKVGILKDSASPHPRIHHAINGFTTYPKIVPESCAKGSRDGRASPLDL